MDSACAGDRKDHTLIKKLWLEGLYTNKFGANFQSGGYDLVINGQVAANSVTWINLSNHVKETANQTVTLLAT